MARYEDENLRNNRMVKTPVKPGNEGLSAQAKATRDARGLKPMKKGAYNSSGNPIGGGNKGTFSTVGKMSPTRKVAEKIKNDQAMRMDATDRYMNNARDVLGMNSASNLAQAGKEAYRNLQENYTPSFPPNEGVKPTSQLQEVQRGVSQLLKDYDTEIIPSVFEGTTKKLDIAAGLISPMLKMGSVEATKNQQDVDKANWIADARATEKAMTPPADRMGEYGKNVGAEGTRYTTPEGEMTSAKMVPEGRRGGYVSGYQPDTRSGGDFYAGRDVSNMTPGDYSKFKVNSMMNAADIMRKTTDAATGGRRRRGSGGGGVDPVAAMKRKETLSEYKSELGDVLRDIKFGRLTAAGGRNAIAGLKAYYGESLGLPPGAEEAGKNYRANVVADTAEANELLRQEGANARSLYNRDKGMTPKMQNFGTRDTPIYGQVDQAGNRRYSPEIERLKADWNAAQTQEEKDMLNEEFQTMVNNLDANLGVL